MRILIIGSKGFIGSHCVSFFSKKGHDVWQCDVMTDYVTEQYHQIDATTANFDEVFEQTTFDVCINCSGAADVSDSIKHPQRDFMLNVANVFKQLDALRKSQPNCKYINFSSAAVYGNPQVLPISETHPLEPISPYGRHKKMAEDICEEFTRQYDIQTLSLRVFSAYGPGLQKQLFWDVYQKTRQHKNIELYGTGKESRDFIYIDDLVGALDLLLKKSHFKHDIVNVANGIEATIAQVTETFVAAIQEEHLISFGGQTRDGDPINWCADITRLKEMGYECKISLKEGLENYNQWLQKLG